MLLDLALRNRRREQDARLGCGACKFGDRDIGYACQRGRRIRRRAAAIGKQETAIPAVASDAIGKGQCKHDAGRYFPFPLRGSRRSTCRLLTRSDLRSPPLRQSPRAAGALRTVATEAIEPGIKINTVAAKSALGQDGGNFG